MDKNSIIHGLQVGSLIAGMRRVIKEPIGYMYNDVGPLPELPEWDREKYPYACLSVVNILNLSYIDQFLLSDYQMAKNSGGFWAVNSVGECKHYSYNSSNSEWVEKSDTVAPAVANIKWANFDIKNEDGTAYLSASDPIPVYE